MGLMKLSQRTAEHCVSRLVWRGSSFSIPLRLFMKYLLKEPIHAGFSLFAMPTESKKLNDSRAFR